jgi:hypothetical protein
MLGGLGDHTSAGRHAARAAFTDINLSDRTDINLSLNTRPRRDRQAGQPLRRGQQGSHCSHLKNSLS